MTTILLTTHLFVLLTGLALGSRLRGRRRYNAGVAAGRVSERLEHGWRDDPFWSAPLPRKRRLWLLLNRQVIPGPPQLVTRPPATPLSIVAEQAR